jgi:CheY-like chemotaxis protein
VTEAPGEARILCVDDEPRVLDGMRRTLGMSFEISTADGGAQAIEMLTKGERFALTISDMRMPGMDGAAYLERAAGIDPDMVRMLLTGQADVQAAIRAINQGRIFRFLTKPCDAEALEQAVADALAQHRLITAERELLQKTVYGCIKVLSELLGLVNPTAFNRAVRVSRLVQQVGKSLRLEDLWQLDMAVMLAHLGCVGLAPELLEKAYAGKPLSQADKSLVQSAPRTAHGLLAGIPRLDIILAILDKLDAAPPALDKHSPSTPDGRILWAAHIILACERADQIRHTHPLPRAVADILNAEHFSRIITEGIGRAEFHGTEQRKVIKIQAHQLEPGMFLIEDARSVAGMLMAKGGQEVTPTVAVLLRRMAERSNLKEPLIVSVTV